MCCLAGGGERTFEEDVACVFGRLDSEEVPAEVAYSTGGGGLMQQGPMWKASIWTRYIVSLRLGQRPREIRGRMSSFRTWGMGVLGSFRRVAQEELPAAVGV